MLRMLALAGTAITMLTLVVQNETFQSKTNSNQDAPPTRRIVEGSELPTGNLVLSPSSARQETPEPWANANDASTTAHPIQGNTPRMVFNNDLRPAHMAANDMIDVNSAQISDSPSGQLRDAATMPPSFPDDSQWQQTELSKPGQFESQNLGNQLPEPTRSQPLRPFDSNWNSPMSPNNVEPMENHQWGPNASPVPMNVDTIGAAQPFNPQESIRYADATDSAPTSNTYSPSPNSSIMRLEPSSAELRAQGHMEQPSNSVLESRLYQMDQNVRQVGFESQTDTSGNSIESFLNEFKTGASGLALPGVPLSVADALRQTDTMRRKEMMSAYWATYESWAQLVDARKRKEQLDSVNVSQTSIEFPLLAAARDAADADVKAAELLLSQKQRTLKAFLFNGMNDAFLALPSDTPLSQEYVTHFEWYAQRNLIRPEHRNIDELLKGVHQLIAKQTSAIQSSKTAMERIQSSVPGGGANVPLLLATLDQYFSIRAKLVHSIVDYNTSISDYSIAIAPFDRGLEELASTMIAPESTATTQTASIATRPSSPGSNQPSGNLSDVSIRQAATSGATPIIRNAPSVSSPNQSGGVNSPPKPLQPSSNEAFGNNQQSQFNQPANNSGNTLSGYGNLPSQQNPSACPSNAAATLNDGFRSQPTSPPKQPSGFEGADANQFGGATRNGFNPAATLQPKNDGETPANGGAVPPPSPSFGGN
ncbi:MAG: hypothetical protein R3C03_10905 [Pirellulaceae bacterium]